MKCHFDKKKIVFILIFTTFIFPSLSFASTTNGTIDISDKYAWGENTGWINFAPTEGGLTITDTAITGHAWSRDVGWINFSATSSGQGVINTCEGILSGSAWSQTLGWIDMTGVTIDASGVFQGMTQSASTTPGRINFSCARCRVSTDWRQCSLRGGGSNQSDISSRSRALSRGGSGITTITDEGGGGCRDIIMDGRMDVFDFNVLMVNWGNSDVGNGADVTGDGAVDIFDFNSVMVCWTQII